MDTVYTLISNVSSQNGFTNLYGFKDLILVVTAFAGTIVAVYGLKAWKNQMKGRNEYDMSRNLLRAIYKTKEGVDHVRNAMITSDEAYYALKESGKEIPEDSFEILGKGINSVYAVRWKYLADALAELHVQKFEAKVLWGDEIEKKILKVFKHVNTLRVFIPQYLDQNFARYNNKEEQKRIKEIVSSGDMMEGISKKSEYGKNLEEIIEDIENYINLKIK